MPYTIQTLLEGTPDFLWIQPTLCHALEHRTLTIAHRFCQRRASYQPSLMKAMTRSDNALTHTQLTENARNTAPAMLTLPALCRKSTSDYLFLHEIIHAYQDVAGLVMWPLLTADNTNIAILDAPSHLRLTLFCEIMAAMESTRWAWQLKQAGNDSAWRGAERSKEWGELAHRYEVAIANPTNDTHENTTMFTWFINSHLPDYYPARARKAHDAFKKMCALKSLKLCHMSFTEIIALLPNELAKHYENLPWAELEKKVTALHPASSNATYVYTEVTRGSALYWASQS